jgi:hypothetical protein
MSTINGLLREARQWQQMAAEPLLSGGHFANKKAGARPAFVIPLLAKY